MTHDPRKTAPARFAYNVASRRRARERVFRVLGLYTAGCMHSFSYYKFKTPPRAV